MVYCGKPSQGCENCRKLHVKCDERRPECSRCLRTKKKCTGYRNQADLMFRDENKTTKEKVGRSYEKTRAPSLGSAGTQTLSLVPPSETYSINSKLFQGFGISLSPSAEDFAVCEFYHSTLNTLSHEDHTRFLHTQLPALYTQSPRGSALRLSTQAIAYASSRNLGFKAARLSRERYVAAIKAAEKAIQDPVEVKSDQTLYAVLLLCGYETLMFDSKTLPAWGSHVDGAAALVRIRGQTELNSPLSRSLFSFVRKNIVLSNMQISRPVDAVFTNIDEMASPGWNVEERLISRMVRIPHLQQLANSLLVHPHRGSRRSTVEQLFDRAATLDHELSDWSHAVPNSWTFSTATNLNAPSTTDFTPSQVHKYSDFYAARVWNMYRVSRLIVQSILLRTISWLQPSSATTVKRNTVERSSRGLVDGICASVPFLFGHKLEKMKVPAPTTELGDKPTISQPTGQTAKGNATAHVGLFSLIWPLYVACSASFVPEEQRRWMRAQLRLIAEYGEPQAQFAWCAESQILSGGAEHFRFDCV